MQLKSMIADFDFYERALSNVRDTLLNRFQNCLEQRPKCCEKVKALFSEFSAEITKPKKRGQFSALLKGRTSELMRELAGCCLYCPPKGFNLAKDPPFYSHGQPAYRKGGVWISPDADEHKKGGIWKMFDQDGNRLGTYDINFKRIGP